MQGRRKENGSWEETEKKRKKCQRKKERKEERQEEYWSGYDSLLFTDSVVTNI